MYIINTSEENSGYDMEGTRVAESSRRKILIFIPSLSGGGAEKVLVNLLNRIDLSKFKITLCIGVNEGIYRSEIPSRVDTVVLFGTQLFEKLAVILHRYLNSRILPLILLRLKIKGSFDTGICFIDGYYTDFMLLLNRRIRKKIAWVHASYDSYINYNKFYKGRYKERLISQRYRMLDRIIFVSHDSLAEFTKVFGQFDNMDVIYNFMDINNIIKKTETETIDFGQGNTVSIVAVGSLLPVKGFDKLIRVAERLKQEGFKFKIRILGEGYLRDKLQRMILSADLEEYVELMGFITNPYPIMRASDIFIMTSESEALPASLCEAMIIGLPGLVTDCSGCREISGNGEYCIMTKQDEDDIYRGIRLLIEDKDLRSEYARKALQRSKIFNDDEVIEKVCSLM